MKREHFKRLIALLIVCAVCIPFFGCGKKAEPEPEKTNETEKKEDVILTLGENEFEIGYTEFNYYYTTIAHDEANKDLSRKEITNQTIYEILMMYAERKLADRYGYELSDEQKEVIENKIKATKDQYETEAEYTEALRKARITEDVMRKVLEYAQIDSGLRGYILDESSGIIPADDKTVMKGIEENFKRCKIIVITPGEDETIEDSNEAAEKVYIEYKVGRTFDELMEQYNTDKEEDPVNGYYFTDGMMDENIEKAVEQTEINEVYGNIVNTAQSSCIVMRLPLEDDYIDSHFEELRTQYITREYNMLVQDTANEMGAMLCDNYDNYNFG